MFACCAPCQGARRRTNTDSLGLPLQRVKQWPVSGLTLRILSRHLTMTASCLSYGLQRQLLNSVIFPIRPRPSMAECSGLECIGLAIQRQEFNIASPGIARPSKCGVLLVVEWLVLGRSAECVEYAPQEGTDRIHV